MSTGSQKLIQYFLVALPIVTAILVVVFLATGIYPSTFFVFVCGVSGASIVALFWMLARMFWCGWQNDV